MITYTNKLDMHPGAVPLVIHVGQYDSDFSLVFNLFSSEGTFTVESSTTAEIRGTKKDGNGYSADATIDISNKRVTIAGHNQMTAMAGRNVFELLLKKSNKVLSTANFILDVEPAAMDAGTIASDSVLKELQAIIDGAETATDAADAAAASAAAAAESARTLTIDATLTQTGQAADAKATGDAIDAIVPGLTDDAKAALLTAFQKTVWLDPAANTFYEALRTALYAETYPKITAEFNPGSDIIYTDYSLNKLKNYLTVKYFESITDTGTVIPSSNYTLTGSLQEGSNSITVSYLTYATNFSVIAVNRSLYILDAPMTLDGSNYLNTNVNLFGENKSFSIVADYVDATNHYTDTQNKVELGAKMIPSPYYGLDVQTYSGGGASGGKYTVRTVMRISSASGQTRGTFDYRENTSQPTLTSHNRLVIRYDHTSGTWKWGMSRGGTVITPTLTNNGYTYQEYEGIVNWGQSIGGAGRFVGTLYGFKIFNYAMSDAETTSYLQGGE